MAITQARKGIERREKMGESEGFRVGVMITENKKATVVRPHLRPASNYTHTHTDTHTHTHTHTPTYMGASNLAIRLLLECHMGTMCAGQWPLGLSTNRAGWKDR